MIMKVYILKPSTFIWWSDLRREVSASEGTPHPTSPTFPLLDGGWGQFWGKGGKVEREGGRGRLSMNKQQCREEGSNLGSSVEVLSVAGRLRGHGTMTNEPLFFNLCPVVTDAVWTCECASCQRAAPPTPH